tara:strand:+ start:534 stop:1148 length:615 start_codon:yes stop_codon:yes gene_type:complete
MTFGLVKHNNNSISAITSAGQLAQGKMTLLQTQTASSSASISFTSNIDSTYPIYIFKFINIHPATDGAEFTINFSTDSGSNYNVAKTTTFFAAYHAEADNSAGITYISSLDLAQGTGGANIFYNVGNGNDESASGTLHLFNPSSTTFVKHFMSTFNVYNNGDNSVQVNAAGYGNTTSAIDGVQFAMSSGNIDSGTIKLYGIKGS